LDEVEADELYSREDADSVTPERLFDRRWASALVEQVLGMLGREYAAAGKEMLFSRLKAGLTGELEPGTIAGWAAELGMSDGAVKVAVHRLRRRFGELLRNEISATVASDAEVNEEIRHLFAAISS
jgi:RNA polymerase sigma-70 factor (ECF subfamily)